ncbi:MAG: ribosome maturation factor RimM [Anaerolineales bacterium]
MPKQPEPSYLAVGRIGRPHGVRGELRAEILTDAPERLPEIPQVYLGRRHTPYKVQSVRLHKGMMLLQLEGVEDRDAAEALRGALVQVAVQDALPLEEGEYYQYQLVGVDVETEAGEPLGQIVEVLNLPEANDVLVVEGARGEVLLPVTQEVVVDLDLEARRLVVRLLPGLLADEEEGQEQA